MEWAIIAPQKMSPGLVKIYQNALMRAVNDPDCRADAEKRRLTLKITAGDKVAAYVKRIYSLPGSTVERQRGEMERAQRKVPRKKKK